jgi:signal transduction histidine kinase
MDPQLFRQVLSNLLHNALEANPNRKVPFRLSLGTRSEFAVLDFENEGVLIDSQMRDRIFEPYVSSKDSESNFGLGLAIARKIVLEHGGDIRLDDCTTGVRFKIELPLNGETDGKSISNSFS